MPSNTEHLHLTTELLDTATANLEDSARNLTHCARSADAIPAPAAYVALGNLKVALWRLRDATHALADGLHRSHRLPAIRITDSDLATGEPRDPSESLHLATTSLQALSLHLADAATHAEAAQAALDGQGYEPASH